MISITNEVCGADADSQIMSLTNNSRDISKNEILKQRETIKNKNTIGHGYITVPSGMEDNLVLNVIRFKDAKDTYLKHLTSWFELDFAWYNKVTKQVMVWGDIEKVKDSIVDLRRLLETALFKDLQRLVDEEKENILKKEIQIEIILKKEIQIERRVWERDDYYDYDPDKHT
jgi:hypothetical protein